MSTPSESLSSSPRMVDEPHSCVIRVPRATVTDAVDRNRSGSSREPIGRSPARPSLVVISAPTVKGQRRVTASRSLEASFALSDRGGQGMERGADLLHVIFCQLVRHGLHADPDPFQIGEHLRGPVPALSTGVAVDSSMVADSVNRLERRGIDRLWSEQRSLYVVSGYRGFLVDVAPQSGGCIHPASPSAGYRSVWLDPW